MTETRRKPLLTPTGLIRGHYECRSFDQTLPILNDILALEVVAEKNGEKTLKHPNTNWRLVVHESGPAHQADAQSLWRARDEQRRSRLGH